MTRAIARIRPFDRLASLLLASSAIFAGGVLLVVPVPAWGWAALRAFLQF